MNSKNKILAMVPAIALGIGLAIPAFAQNNPSASAGSSMQQAGHETAGAAKSAYDGTAMALSDTAITTKVKTAYASGKNIKSNDIHVSTTAGVVTLGGHVQSSHMERRVVAIARDTKGVLGVTNNLRVTAQN